MVLDIPVTLPPPLHWQETPSSIEERKKISTGWLFRRSLCSLRPLATLTLVFLWLRVTPIVFIPAKASSFPGLQCVLLCPVQFWRPELIGQASITGFPLGSYSTHQQKSVASKDFLIFNWKFPFTQTLSITPAIFSWIFSLKQRTPLASILPRRSFITVCASPAFQKNCLSQPCPALVHPLSKEAHSLQCWEQEPDFQKR